MTTTPRPLKAAVAEEQVPRQGAALAARPLLVCLSHLRWGFVYQRPQHLMSRMTREFDVVFFEEPLPGERSAPYVEAFPQPSGVTVLTPRLPQGLDAAGTDAALRTLLDDYLASHAHGELLLWYFTPMSLTFSEHLTPNVTIYDCMDELSAFHGAPPELITREKQLLAKADVVFTGGVSIWEAKKNQHPNAHAMPSSVDIQHFGAARTGLPEPLDQAAIAQPRLGFFGVIDERFDAKLMEAVARQRPDWQWVILGPVVKIDPASLPALPNIHYLGGKGYDELPAYLGGWDVATMPFARNEATRFISPTKTPEYLAGGCPVVSTSITDVVRTYGHSEVVHIADEPAAFIAAVEQALAQRQHPEHLLAEADKALDGMSWDTTWNAMMEQIKCLA